MASPARQRHVSAGLPVVVIIPGNGRRGIGFRRDQFKVELVLPLVRTVSGVLDEVVPEQ